MTDEHRLSWDPVNKALRYSCSRNRLTTRNCCGADCRPPPSGGRAWPATISPGAITTRIAVPVDDLIVAATTALEREGRSLASYGLASGPQGHRRLREFLAFKLKRDAGLLCQSEDILLTSGSLQALGS